MKECVKTIRKTAGIAVLTGILLLAGSAAGELSTNLQVRKEINPNNKKVATQTYVDKDGNPTIADDKGYATVRYTYATGNQIAETAFLDAQGKPVESIDGYAVMKCQYSGKNLAKTEYFDAKGRPVNGPEGYARKETKYWYKKHNSTWEYDADGNPVNLHRISEFKNTNHPSLMTSDSWYDADNNPAAGPCLLYTSPSPRDRG